jgi:phosphopantothenoylcysteine decarboxylase/phosphopantothenate--cysteine ligase
MGYALARAAHQAAGEVLLVSGPVALEAPAGVERILVESACQMHQQVMARIGGQDLFIGAAAVADFRPAEVAPEKIKKGEQQGLGLSLVRNPDVLADVAGLQNRPFCVGFAAETQDVRENALDKLQRKGLDMIVANQVGGDAGGFERDHNAVTLIWPDGEQAFPLEEKGRLAERIIDRIAERYQQRGKV